MNKNGQASRMTTDLGLMPSHDPADTQPRGELLLSPNSASFLIYCSLSASQNQDAKGGAENRRGGVSPGHPERQD